MWDWFEIEWTWDYWIPVTLEGVTWFFLVWWGIFSAIVIWVYLTDRKVTFREGFLQWLWLSAFTAGPAAASYGFLALYNQTYVSGEHEGLGALSRYGGMFVVGLIGLGVFFFVMDLLEDKIGDAWNYFFKRRKSAVKSSGPVERRVDEGFRRLALAAGIILGVIGAVVGVVLAAEIDDRLSAILIVAGFSAFPFLAGWGVIRIIGWIVAGFVSGPSRSSEDHRPDP